MTKEVAKYNNCFVCGFDNPIGLKLKFYSEGDRAWTEYHPSKQHEGYKGILHGGLIATVLDEVMIKAILAKDIFCVTARMELKYKAPAPVDRNLIFEAEIKETKKRTITTTGIVKDETGNIYAEATGTYIIVNDNLKERLKQSLST